MWDKGGFSIVVSCFQIMYNKGMEKLLTPEDIAEILGIHIETVRRFAREGRLVGVKIGLDWRFKREDVEEFIEERRMVKGRK